MVAKKKPAKTPKPTARKPAARPAARKPPARKLAVATPTRPVTRGSPSVPLPTAVPGLGAAFLTQDPKAAYDHFLPDAQAVSAADRIRLNIDPDIVRSNVTVAMKALASLQPAIAKAVPGCPIPRMQELGSLALGLGYAAGLVIGQASTGDIAQRLAAVGKLRTPALRQLEVFADLGLADPNRVKAIRAGTGALDKAHDAVDIAAYFGELGASIAGKHPFTAARDRRASHRTASGCCKRSPRAARSAPPAPPTPRRRTATASGRSSPCATTRCAPPRPWSSASRTSTRPSRRSARAW